MPVHDRVPEPDPPITGYRGYLTADWHWPERPGRGPWSAATVTGDAEHRNAFDWRPKGWLYDEQNGNWYSPEQKAKLDEIRAVEAAKAAVVEPEHKDDFIVADASDITNAVTRKRLPGKLPVPQLPQV